MCVSLPSFLQRRIGRRDLLLGSAGLCAGAAVTRRMLGNVGVSHAVVELWVSPEAPFAFLSTDTVQQGGAFSLHVQTSYADSATASFNGRDYPLVSIGDYLVGVLGAGQPVNDETEIEPGDYRVQVNAVTSGVAPYTFNLPITVRATLFPVDAIDLPPATTALLAPATVQQELARLVALYQPAEVLPLWKGLFRQPIQGPITTQFGEARSYNGAPAAGHHSGVDIGADQGTPVGAAAAGRVSFAGPLAERGNMVIVSHGLGVFTGYAHLSQINAAPGDMVVPGMVIGLVGTTGLSTGPHLHWECVVNGMHTDAMRWTHDLLP